MTEVPFAALTHPFPPRPMANYQVLSDDGCRVVSTIVKAATDTDAIAAVSAFFGAGAIEISQDGRHVHGFNAISAVA